MSVSIADNYLTKLAMTNQKAPCLVTLGVASLFLAAKLEQPKEPDLVTFLYYLEDKHNVLIKRSDLIDFESRLITELEFRIRFVTPFDFLSRFSRLLEIDAENYVGKSIEKIEGLALQFCRYMLINASFLPYKPQQIAAASLLLGMRMK